MNGLPVWLHWLLAGLFVLAMAAAGFLIGWTVL